MIKEYPEIGGRTFIVGDLHGCFDEFHAELEKVNFDFSSDRVFSVGDLTDRGVDNMECLRLLNMPWFHAVRGNHDDLIVGTFVGSRAHQECWLMNGGDWAVKLDSDDKLELVDVLLPILQELPYVIKVGNIAIVHAECQLSCIDDVELDDAQSLTWGRNIINRGIAGIVGGAEHIVVGHSVVPKPVRIGNHVFIDTGAVFGTNCNTGNDGYLTLININDVPNVKEAE